MRAAGAAGALTAAGGLGLGSLARVLTASAAPPLPSPDKSGIDHIVFLCMENRSFDHYLGWLGGAEGRQGGLQFADDNGAMHGTHALSGNWDGCGFNDPDHSYDGARTQLDNGKMDGFRKGTNDDFALGYYTAADVPTHAAICERFTVFDHWFCSFLGPTYPNRFYTHAGATDRNSNASTTSTLPTIWDSLSAAGVSANYFFTDLPFLALWGQKYANIARPIDAFFQVAANGQLPSVSYIDPGFESESGGSSNDDHPQADIRRGQNLIGRIINTLIAAPTWPNTVLVTTYDEWGGFFEHVVPPRLADDGAGPATVTGAFDHDRAGFRVPAYVISPFSPQGQIVKKQFDHTSVLKLIEWRFALKALTPRDAAAANIAEVLDFTAPNLHAGQLPLVADPGPHVCQSGQDVTMPTWPQLAASPETQQFKATVEANHLTSLVRGRIW